jgi:hypothetical protein
MAEHVTAQMETLAGIKAGLGRSIPPNFSFHISVFLAVTDGSRISKQNGSLSVSGGT